MGLLDRFRRKKKNAEGEGKALQEQKTITELEQLCRDDKEVYEALLNTMYLNPKKLGVTMKEAAENAKKAEKEKDLVRANLWYRIAGGLAIYEGNVKKVVEYFSESQKISGFSYPILKVPEKAVAVAQEYYKKYLKE
ncbi:MAG: hypothetical protein ACP5IM_07245 [Candidatus Bathyarchaeia archaeon]|nr:MAG: hypothetical protein C0195_00890 [Candidatus Bathyarchaeota archaeon]